MANQVEGAKYTPEEYAELHPGECPVCGSSEIEGHSIDIEGQSAFQEVTCLSCPAGWQDVYRLECYSELEMDGVPVKSKSGK
jgi:formate dehydrogenase maturation protein FdhE|tara:strand:+ start:46 stop:291 length:246 start_codon:yes stop_codon:yes gene_type:complete